MLNNAVERLLIEFGVADKKFLSLNCHQQKPF